MARTSGELASNRGYWIQPTVRVSRRLVSVLGVCVGGEVTDIRYMVESRLCYVGVDQSGVTWLVANGCTSPAIVTPAVVYTGVAIHNSYIRVIRFSPCATHPHISQLLPNNTSHHHKNKKIILQVCARTVAPRDTLNALHVR